MVDSFADASHRLIHHFLPRNEVGMGQSIALNVTTLAAGREPGAGDGWLSAASHFWNGDVPAGDGHGSM